MKRRNFLLSTLATTGFTISQLNVFAHSQQAELGDPQKPFIVKAGKSRLAEEQGNIYAVKVSAKDTNGQMSVFESIDETGPSPGPPLHIHPNQDETFFIIEGEFLFQLGDEKIKVSAGDTVFGPRGIPHSFCQLSKKGHMIFAYNPAGQMEEVFSGLTNMLKTNTFNPESFNKLCAENGVKNIGPRMKPNE